VTTRHAVADAASPAQDWRWPIGARSGFPIRWYSLSWACWWCTRWDRCGRESGKAGLEAARIFGRWCRSPCRCDDHHRRYVVASTPLVRRGIHWLAGVPKTPRGAVTLVALVATTSSLISWGSADHQRLFGARDDGRVKGMDYRAAGTAAYLGRVRCGRWGCRRRRLC